MRFTTIDQVLWVVGLLGHVSLLLVLLRRARWREFPIFTGLIGYQVLVTMILFAIYQYGSPHAYFIAYWQLALGDYCFQVALLVEMARNVFQSARPSVDNARKCFLGFTGACVLLFLGLCIVMSPPGVSGLDLWEMRATLFTSLLTCGLFVSISAGANYLGLPWRSHVIALGQGLAAWSAVAVLGDVVHIATGWHQEFAIFDHVRMYVYIGALVFWTATFWAEERKLAPLSEDVQLYIEALHHQVRLDLERISKLAPQQHPSSAKNRVVRRSAS